MAQANPNVLNPTQTDPLAQLRDIRLPGPLEVWPPAIGWWVLAAVVLLLVIAALWFWYRHFQRNRYRREARRALEQLWQAFEESGDSATYLAAYARLLKLTALSRYPREQVASLTGEAWVHFLDRSAGTDDFSMGPGQALIVANYAPNLQVEIQELHELGRFWINSHRDLPVLEEAA